MAIADTISSMYENVGEVYDTITNVDVNTGKNLISNIDIYNGYVQRNIGNAVVYYSSANTITYKKCAYVEANKTYTLSWNYSTPKLGASRDIIICDNNDIELEYFAYSNTNNTKSNTFTPTYSGWVYACLDANAIKVQLELGSSATDYHSYTDNPTYKNIENIPKVIRNSYLEIMNNGTDKIWNNWEKVTGSGTDISLSPTLEAPMRNVLNGNTYQFTTTGKNLLPNNQTTQTINGLTFTVNGNKSITITGTATANTDYYFVGTASQYVDFGLTTGTYNLSGCSGGSEQTYMLFAVMNRNGSIYYYGSFVDTGRKMIVETGDTFRIFIRVISGQTMNTTMYPMVERGDNKTTYEPYTGGATPRPDYPRIIRTVNGNNKIIATGKNLLPINLTGGVASGITFTNNLDGTFSAKGTSTAGVGQNICGEITLKAGTYTFSVNNLPTGVYLSLNNVGYTMLNSSNLKRIFTLNQDTTFPRCLLWVDSNKTIDATFEVLLEKGNTATDFEPYSSDIYNIDLPIENLCNVSNTITTSAFGMNVTLNGDVVTCSGTPTRQYINTEAVNLINPLKAGDTYNFVAFSDNLPSGLNFRIWGYNSDNVLKFNVKSGSSLAITEDIIKYRLVLEGMTTGTNYNIQAKLQLEKGNKINSYTPYGMEPIKMCNINTYKDGFLRTTGKNLLHQDEYISSRTVNGITYTNNGDGTFSITGTATANTSINILYSASQVGLESGKTYYFYSSQPYNSQTFNMSIPFKQDGTQKYLTANNTITTSGVLTTISLAFYTNSGNTINAQNVKLMLVEGDTPGDYEPYGKGEWYLQQSIGEVVFTNATNWYYDTSNTRFSTQVNGSRTEGSRFPIVSNYFSYASSGGGNGVGFNYGGSIWLYNYDCTSVSEFQAWLGEHNTDVYYILATPTYTKITYEPLLEQLEAFYNAKSKNSQTNITQENNDLPFIIDSTMLKEV